MCGVTSSAKANMKPMGCVESPPNPQKQSPIRNLDEEMVVLNKGMWKEKRQKNCKKERKSNRMRESKMEDMTKPNAIRSVGYVQGSREG